MVNIRYNDSANIDLLAALKSIRHFFVDQHAPDLGEKHVNIFREELKRKEELIRNNPELYPVRKEYISKNK
jgi:hypothetical protein